MVKKEFVKPTTRVVQLQASVNMLIGSSGSSSTKSSISTTGLDDGEQLKFADKTQSTGADPWEFAW
ncbi:MAG: hypothetical protein IJR02_06685 [Bacteroidaceae bacterium]|nr:hypothetical protein [Bacteroidaceae bacterium]